ncbi:MAG: hypothetical protein AB2L14_29775 [Candidatus Xenobiia bacterium LiM19]
MTDVKEYKDLNELFCSVGLESFREIVERVIEKAEDVLVKGLREYELRKEADERQAGRYVMECLIPLVARLPSGEKEPVMKMISERTKSIGIGIREIKKAAGVPEQQKNDEEEGDVDIMETIPDIIDQPLAVIRDKVYAITRLWVTRKKGDVTEQEEMEYVISDKGEAIPRHKARTLLNLKITLKELPLPSLLLSGRAVNAFVKGSRPEIYDVFDCMVQAFNRFIDFSLSFGSQEQMCKLSACLSLLTWFRLATEALPYPWPNGEKGSGKTQWGIVWAMCSFLGKAITAGSSFAVLRDYAGFGASLMIDDAERLMDLRDKSLEDVRELFLSGYRKGTSVDIKEKSGDNWVSKVINSYCPKAFTAIKIPEGALGSRVIRIPLVRSIDPKKTNSDPTNLRLWPCDWGTLKDDSWLCALMHLQEAKCINDELNSETELSGRDYERWKGVFLVARLLDRNGKGTLEAEMREVMYQYFKDDAGESSDDERIPIIIDVIERRLQQNTDTTGKITMQVKVIAAAVTERAIEAGFLSNDKTYSPISIGRILNRLRIGKTIHKEKGSIITISFESLQHVKKVFQEKNKFSALTEKNKLSSVLSEPHNSEDLESSVNPSGIVRICQADENSQACLPENISPKDSIDDDKYDNGGLPTEWVLGEELPF